jgi:chromosome segregation ATPase
MTRTAATLVIAGAVLAWGCGTKPTTAVTDPAKLKSLEARVAKLEAELSAAHAARDQAAARAKLAEEKLAKEIARGLEVERERDGVRADLRVRLAERDALQGQFDGFRKNLRDLLGQADAAATVTPSTVPSPTALGTGSAARGY